MLKIIACILMCLDHVCIFFYPDQAYWMRTLGQSGFPIFAFLIVQGYKYTSDKKQYLINLVLFAGITQPLYTLLFPEDLTLNALFMLSYGLILIMLYERYGYKSLLISFVLVGFNVISIYIYVIVIMHLLQDDKIKMFLALSVFYSIVFTISGEYYIFGSLLYFVFYLKPLPRLTMNKFYFYSFYPFHFLVIFHFLN